MIQESFRCAGEHSCEHHIRDLMQFCNPEIRPKPIHMRSHLDLAPTITIGDGVNKSRMLHLAAFVDSGISMMARLVHRASKIRAAILCKSIRTRWLRQNKERQPALPLTS